MLENLLSPLGDWGLLILRLALGIIFFAHGWPKLKPKGPIGGPGGFAGFLRQMGVPFPTLFAWVVALLETLGAVLLILGLGTRILATGFVIDMVMAIQLVRRPAGARFSSMEGIGWEYELLLGAVSLALVFLGAGVIGLDRLIGL